MMIICKIRNYSKYLSAKLKVADPRTTTDTFLPTCSTSTCFRLSDLTGRVKVVYCILYTQPHKPRSLPTLLQCLFVKQKRRLGEGKNIAFALNWPWLANMIILKNNKIDFRLKPTAGMDSPHPNTSINMNNMAIKVSIWNLPKSNKFPAIRKGRGP